MPKFFEALFNGGGTLATYTPDVGSAPTSVEIDLQNNVTYLYNVGGVPSLSSVDVADGFAKPKDPALNGITMALKLPPSPVPDYYVEIEFDGNPSLSTFYAVLCLRSSTMVTGAWTSAINTIGAELDIDAGEYAVYFNEISDGLVAVDSVLSGSWSSGMRTWLLRASVGGNQITATLNGSVTDVRTISSTNLAAAGDTYVVLDFIVPDASGGYINIPIRRIEAGYDTTLPITNRNTLRPKPFAPGIPR